MSCYTIYDSSLHTGDNVLGLYLVNSFKEELKITPELYLFDYVKIKLKRYYLTIFNGNICFKLKFFF